MRTLLPLLAAAVLTATLVQPAAAADNPTWSPALTSGIRRGRRGAGRGRAHRPAHGVPRPREDGAAEGTPDTAVATGLLTLDPHRLDSPTNRIAARVAARLTEGATADVDVRGLRASGNWSEWIPAERRATAVLPEPVLDVQARLVLTGDPGPEATGLDAHRARDRPASKAPARRATRSATRSSPPARGWSAAPPPTGT